MGCTYCKNRPHDVLHHFNDYRLQFHSARSASWRILELGLQCKRLIHLRACAFSRPSCRSSKVIDRKTVAIATVLCYICITDLPTVVIGDALGRWVDCVIAPCVESNVSPVRNRLKSYTYSILDLFRRLRKRTREIGMRPSRSTQSLLTARLLDQSGFLQTLNHYRKRSGPNPHKRETIHARIATLVHPRSIINALHNFWTWLPIRKNVQPI